MQNCFYTIARLHGSKSKSQEKFMSTRVSDLLIELSQNPFRCEEIKKAAQQVLEGAQLDPPESAVLLSGNIEMYLAGKKKKGKGKKKDPDKRTPTIDID
jgi:hypothetical protein